MSLPIQFEIFLPKPLPTFELSLRLSVSLKFFSLVFAVNRIFNSYFVLVLVAVTCFFIIINILSIRLRREEFTTIKKLGGSRFFVFKLYACEYAVLLTSSLAFTVMLALIAISIIKSIYL